MIVWTPLCRFVEDRSVEESVEVCSAVAAVAGDLFVAAGAVAVEVVAARGLNLYVCFAMTGDCDVLVYVYFDQWYPHT